MGAELKCCTDAHIAWATNSVSRVSQRSRTTGTVLNCPIRGIRSSEPTQHCSYSGAKGRILETSYVLDFINQSQLKELATGTPLRLGLNLKRLPTTRRYSHGAG